MHRANWTSNTLLIFSCCLAIFFLCPEIALAPNSYLFSDNPDGIKNYYTFLYQQKYGTGFHFMGMNYPFGENLIYVDAIPIFSTLMSFINSNICLLYTSDAADE